MFKFSHVDSFQNLVQTFVFKNVKSLKCVKLQWRHWKDVPRTGEMKTKKKASRAWNMQKSTTFVLVFATTKTRRKDAPNLGRGIGRRTTMGWNVKFSVGLQGFGMMQNLTHFVARLTKDAYPTSGWNLEVVVVVVGVVVIAVAIFGLLCLPGTFKVVYRQVEAVNFSPTNGNGDAPVLVSNR